MKTFLITYDLIAPRTAEDYQQLHEAIKAFTYWAKPLESVWLIKSDLSREQIMNFLRQRIKVNDKLLIIEVTNNWIALGLDQVVVEWMRKSVL